MPLPRTIGTGRALLAPGGAFSPLQLTGLGVWLRADQGVYQDSAMTTPAVADADPVGGWQDQSGNGKHVTQATSTKRPSLKLAIQNGLPMLRFDGIDDYLVRTTALSTAITGRTILAAFRTAASAPAGFIAECHRFTNYAVMDLDSTKLRGLVNVDLIRSAIISTSTAYIGSVYHENGQAIQVRLNSVLSTSVATPSITPVSQQLLVGIHESLSAAQFNSDLGELIYYARSLSSGEIAQVEQYLKTRWGVA